MKGVLHGNVRRPLLDVVEVNEWGDLQCPYCKVFVITPRGCELRSGTAGCPLCGRGWFVSGETADKGNLVRGGACVRVFANAPENHSAYHRRVG